MKKIFEYWTEPDTGREGYSIADVTFHSEILRGSLEEYGKDRKTLKAAINDAIRFYNKYSDGTESIGIYAQATITMVYDDGEVKFKDTEDCIRMGSILNGEYFDLCEQVEWL